MQFEFDQTEPIYQQIADQLEDMIFTGLLKEGEQAPSTTQLSQEPGRCTSIRRPCSKECGSWLIGACWKSIAAWECL